MRVYGIVGWKNAGKTTLMERLVAEITGRGFSVSTVKHVHHDVDLDQPGKDTFRHRQAGAREVILASAQRFALMREHRGPEPDLASVLARLAPVDLVLVEGYKRDAHPKVEVFRAGEGRSPIQPSDPTVRAVATDAALAGTGVPLLDLNDPAAVADFILRETGLMPVFDKVAIVDWSAAASPSPARPSADAIWIGIAAAEGVSTQYLRTRAEAEAVLAALIETERSAGRRLLIGFDFPMGYPAGFAARLTGAADARAVWRWLAGQIVDGPANANNRFEVAAAINRHLGGTPFWGRPAGLTVPDLPDRKTGGYAALGLTEKRAAERLLPGSQPVWKLYTTGSVGGQSLTGLPMIHRLARMAGVAVWPFDAPPAPVVLAEVWPSLLADAVRRRMTPGTIRDQVQVTVLARALWRLDRQGGMAALLEVPEAAREEGWVLGLGHREALERALE
ncbi:MAG: molybdopterin-guanine dinucleotide biosynthesis protein B [Paracoccaceae bacterium]